MGRLSAWLAIALLLGTAGCGSDTLWQRYQAERTLWRAHRTIERLRIEPRLNRPEDVAHAIAVHQRVVDGYPPERWVPLALAGDPLARDIAVVSGQASLAIAELEALRGRPEAAVDAYRRVGSAYRGLWPIEWQAPVGAARLLERSGDSALALPHWERVARGCPLVAPGAGTLVDETFEAQRRVAAADRRAGRGAAFDSLLAAGEARIEAALRRPLPNATVAALWIQLARLRSERDGPKAAHVERLTWQQALAQRGLGERRPDVVLAIGECALAEGLPDSAIVYARWVQTGFDRSRSMEGTVLEARAWSSVGELDSAAAAYEHLLDMRHVPARDVTEARFRQAHLLAQLDRWEMARGSFHEVVASDPLNPLAFAAMEAVVQHHLNQDEAELAEIEGRWALDKLAETMATVRDPGVLANARATRAWILEAIDDPDHAVEAYTEIWHFDPRAEGAAAAAFAAARLAALRLHDAARAETLYDEVARMAPRPEDRSQARQQALDLRRPTR